MGATDQMLARYAAEIEERQAFIDGLVQAAGDGDLSPETAELVAEARKRMDTVQKMMAPLIESRRISDDSAQRVAEIARFMTGKQEQAKVEYRSAGEYIRDLCDAHMGNRLAAERLDIYNLELRAAAHQTTADNPGTIPTPILGPVVSFVDSARPLVSALSPKDIPSGSFSRPKVTQHTLVDVQSAEKAELSSQKMTISKLPVTPATLGTYLNVSRQDLDWSVPAIMDIVVNDMAAQYAIKTEATAAQAFYTGATASAGTAIPATPTAANVSTALWTAAGEVYTATKGVGRLIAVASPDVLGILGGLFAPVNPQNAQSAGFNAADFGQGLMGSIGGIPIYVTAGFAAAKSLLVLSTAAAEVYEQRIGILQVIEPSVLGTQVAFGGYFAQLIVEATGIVKVTVT